MGRESADVATANREDAVRGEAPRGVSVRDGDAERGGALNAGNEMDGRRGELGKLSLASCAARPDGGSRPVGKGRFKGELGGDEEPSPAMSLTARNAEIGLVPLFAPTW